MRLCSPNTRCLSIILSESDCIVDGDDGDGSAYSGWSGEGCCKQQDIFAFRTIRRTHVRYSEGWEGRRKVVGLRRPGIFRHQRCHTADNKSSKGGSNERQPTFIKTAVGGGYC